MPHLRVHQLCDKIAHIAAPRDKTIFHPCRSITRKSQNLFFFPPHLLLVTAGIPNLWQDLSSFDPQDVCHRAQVLFDATMRFYTIRSLGQEFSISPQTRQIIGCSQTANNILPRIEGYAQIAFPFYLAQAQEHALSEHFVNPRALKGGAFFAQGTHALPLAKIAAKFGSDIEPFLAQGRTLAGEIKEYGDAAWQVFPLPRVPVLIVLWLRDEEFPPRAEILFDTTTTYLPIDILWATAMMCVTAIL